MTNQLNFQSVQENLNSAKDILVLIKANPNLDQVAAGLGLYLSLKKQDRNVVIGCPTSMTVAFNRLIGVNKISSSLGNRNLIISFDYIEESIEKVSYNIEDNKFNIVIEPKSDFPTIDSQQVNFNYSGTRADLIFVIGAQQLDDLQNFYTQNKQVFEQAATVNIDNKTNNKQFGKINLIKTEAVAISEIMASMIKSLGMPADEDVVTNLYAGIKTNSSNFQADSVNADTFELSAWLLKNGAKKDQLEVIESMQPQKAEILSQTQAPSKIDEAKPSFPVSSQPLSQSQQSHQQAQEQAQEQAKASVPKPPFTGEDNKDSSKPQPPPDWFKPKIYKGGQSVK
jgi:nanoRNase/pAp phosphatase (c-di-AMP/oligoRNAs hydrolase)